MKASLSLFLTLLVGGCASSTSAPPPTTTESLPAKTPNWEEIDKTVQRVKEREKNKGRLVETGRTTEQGFFPMSEADYTAALDSAREEVKKANPKMSDADVEAEAIKKADAAKYAAEHSYSARASSTYEWKKP